MSGFNWWLVAPAQTMGIDNANANPIDVSTLAPTTRMVQWREGRGEIELTTGPPLRTTFTDPTPYAAFFQQFMTLLTSAGLTLAQAQKIQNDLVDCIYDSKRQLPFSFNVASGPGTEIWSARDEDVLAMCTEVLAQVGVAAAINGVVTQINAGIVTPGNTHVTVTNTVKSSLDSSIIPTLSANLQTTPLTITVTGSGVSSSHSPSQVASPGLPTGLSGTGAATAPTMSAIAGVSLGSMPWSPISATAPLSVTMNEMIGLMGGIASRRQTLLNTRYTKRAAINALSTIAAVIAYDVTSGW